MAREYEVSVRTVLTREQHAALIRQAKRYEISQTNYARITLLKGILRDQQAAVGVGDLAPIDFGESPDATENHVKGQMTLEDDNELEKG